MAAGKTRDGAELGPFCAVYGLPTGNRLTYEEFVVLTLGAPWARAVLSSVAVDAARIAKGELGDKTFYELDALTDKEAEHAYDRAILRCSLNRGR